MLRILSSNQPVAWTVVPVTGIVLMLISRAVGLVSGGAFVALSALCLSAWLLHRMHAESAMRTRPGSLPAWAWMLVATPLVGLVPDGMWWSIPCYLQGLRLSLRLRDKLGSPGTFMFIGMWWGAGALIEASTWPFIPAFVVATLWVQRPVAEELVAGMIGLLTPVTMLATILWLLGRNPMSAWGWHPAMENNWPLGLTWLIIPAGLGWVLRQQSLVRATAQQRFSRQVTQWSGLFVLVLAGLAAAAQWGSGGQDGWGGATALPAALAFMSAWSWPWLVPPGFRWTKAMPFLMMAGSLGLIALRAWPLL